MRCSAAMSSSKERSSRKAPELPFLGGVASQLSCRAADADELGPLEGHRSARRAFDLEQDQPRSIHRDLMEPEVDLRVEKTRQPRFEELVPLSCGTRNEVRSHEVMGAVPDPPEDVAVRLAMQDGRIGEGGQVFADLVGMSVVLLEFHPLRLVRQGAEPAHQIGEVAG